MAAAPALRAANLLTLPGELDMNFYRAAGADGVVMDVALDGDQVVMGGTFTRVDGQLRNGIARLNPNGSVDTAFIPPAALNITTGFVWTVAVQTNNYVIFGGQFTLDIGIAVTHIARLEQNGRRDASFRPGSGPNGAVADIVLQPDGRILIGGDFTGVSGFPRPFVARLNSDGTLEHTLNTALSGLPGFVRALALQPDGRVLVGGQSFVARLSTGGGLDPSFPMTPINGVVEGIAVQDDGRVVIGGHFTMVNGVPRSRVARLLANGTVDDSFNPGGGPNGVVTTLALQRDGKVFLGGGFTSVNGQTRHRIARLQADGRLDAVFVPRPGASDWVESLALQSDDLVVAGGAFTNVNGVARNHLARLYAADPPPFSPVFLATPSNSTVNEGGTAELRVEARAFPEPTFRWQFKGADVPGGTGDVLRLRNVRLSHAGDYRVEASNNLGSTSAVVTLTVVPAPLHPGTPDVSFFADLRATNNLPAASLVSALAVQNDRRLIVGGAFDLVNGVRRPHLARLMPNGDLDPTFVPAAGRLVNALVLQDDGKVLVGAGTLPGTAVIRLMPGGEFDATFRATLPQVIGGALALQSDGKVLVSGRFFGSYAGVLYRLHADGVHDTGFVPWQETSGGVDAIALLPDGRILIGGEFTSVQGFPRQRIAQFQGDGRLDVSFDPGAGAMGGTSFIDEYGDALDKTVVLAVAVQPDGRLLIGGEFRSVNGIARSRIARLFPDGQLDPTFDPGPGPDNSVLALALQRDGKVLIGGSFTTINGLTHNRIARLQADGSLDLTFAPLEGANGNVLAVTVLNDGAIFIGGDFTTVNGIPRPGVARLNGGDPPPAAPNILTGPTNITANEGEDVSFFVLASGWPPPSYQWLFNDTAIPGANRWLLTIPDVRATNAGTYRVGIGNSRGGILSAPASLTVVPASRQAGAADIRFRTGFGPSDLVHAIALQPDGKILIGGDFTQFDGVRRGRVARLERNGALDLTFDPGLGADGIVHALAVQPDGRILLGGDFFKVDGFTRGRLMRLNSDGSVDASFLIGLGADGPVWTVRLDGEGKILIGGLFVYVQGIPRPGLARLDQEGKLDLEFVPSLAFGSAVRQLALQPDGRVLLAGRFYSTAFATRVGRLMPNGAWDTSFSVETQAVAIFSGSAFSLALPDNSGPWIGGDFTNYAGLPRNRLARLNPDGTIDLGFGLDQGADHFVHTIALQDDGKPVLGGRFTSIGGRARSRIARLETNGLVDPTFEPGAGATGGTLAIDGLGNLVDLTAVLAVAIEEDGHLLIGGDFTKVNGIRRPYLARLYGHEPPIEIRALVAPSGEIELRWETGVLQHATRLDGPWTDIIGAQSPQRVFRLGGQRFFRLRN